MLSGKRVQEIPSADQMARARKNFPELSNGLNFDLIPRRSLAPEREAIELRAQKAQIMNLNKIPNRRKQPVKTRKEKDIEKSINMNS